MPDSRLETPASLINRLPNKDDVVAWDEFVHHYGPVVSQVAKRRGLQDADSYNLVQEVFLSVMQSIETWLARDDRGSFRAWLLRVAHNQAVDLLTSRATRNLVNRDQQNQLAENASDRNEISEMIEQEHRRAIFHRAANQVRKNVTHLTWQAFWLTEVMGKSVEQVAEQLDMRTGNIYVSRSRVMARIKKLALKYEDLS